MTDVEERVEAPVRVRQRQPRQAASSALANIRKSYQQVPPVQSSRTSSADPMDLFAEDPIVPPPRSAPRGSIFDGLEAIAAACGGQIHCLTPASLLVENPPPVYYAKDLDSTILDEVNAMPEQYRNSDNVRDIFECLMRQNTYEDEPDAPPIMLQNEWDDQATPPWEFYYSNRVWLGKGVPDPNLAALEGCGCEGVCDPNSKTCACYKRNRRLPDLEQEKYEGWPYEIDKKNKSKPKTLKLKSLVYPVFECNALCGCSDSCINRVRTVLVVVCDGPDISTSECSTRTTSACRDQENPREGLG